MLTRPFVVALCAAAGVGAAASGASPTGWVVTDILFTAGLGAATTLAAPLVGARLVAVATGLAVLCSGGSSTSAVCAGLGFGVAVAIVAIEREAPVLVAAAGGALALAALRFDWPQPLGTPSLAAAVVLAPVLLAGLRLAPANVRRLVRRGAGGAVAFSVVAGALALLGALGARTSVDAGVQAARDGLTAVSQANPEEAGRRFDEAAASFRKADNSIGAFWARPGLAVPIVGQHAKALRALASTGKDLAIAGARAAREADPSTLRLVDGAFDLQALEAVRAPLENAWQSLRRSRAALDDADSPWLVAPVATRLAELTAKVRSASASTETAVLALRNAPAFLGVDGPRRYFLAVQTPAEARAAGGLIGNWGELLAVDGRITLGRFGRTQELNEGGDPATRRLSGPADYVRRYQPYKPFLYWQSITMSPDFPTVAEVIAELYPQSGGAPIDGVISVDPYALAALLRLIGPVPLDGDRQLTADNAAPLLLHEQYLEFGEEQETDRVDFLAAATSAVFQRLTSTTLPKPQEVADVLAPIVAGRHLQLASVHPAEQRFFERLGATGAVPPVRGDFLGVVTQNFNGNKIDWYMKRSYDYDAEYDPGSGEVRATLTVRLRNDAPADGLPRSVVGYGGPDIPEQPHTAFGENLTLLTVYSPLELVSMTVDDGQELGLSKQNELGRRVYSALVSVKTRSTRTVTVELAGRIRAGDYRLDVLRQATVVPDEASLSVTVASGWQVEEGGRNGVSSAHAQVTVDRTRTLEVGTERAVNGVLGRLRRGR